MGWRSIYYSLLAGLGVAVLITPYSLTYSAFLVGQSLLVAVLICGVLAAVQLYRAKPDKPVAFLVDHRSEYGRAALDRLALIVSGTLFLTWLPPLKAMIPVYAGFWADPLLTKADRLLLGRDGFDLTHAITPDWAHRLIDVGYSAWPLVAVMTLAAVVMLGRNLGQFMLAWALSWIILGVFAAVALASAGPIFGADLGFGFAHLASELEGTIAMRVKDSLWHVHSTNSLTLGGGISAAPSMHCANAFMLLFAAWRTAWRIPALLYAAFIWFGSVYLGWHYAVDGLISLVGMAIIWRLAGRLCARDLKAQPAVADTRPEGLYAAGASRKRLGLLPVQRLNAREKAAGSEKPSL